MRPLALLLLLLTLAARTPAQPTEKVHELGKTGLTLEGRIDANDAKVKVKLDDGKTFELPAKRYLVRLPSGKSYHFTMRSKELGSFLILQDADGKQLVYDDDSGGDLESPLTFAALIRLRHVTSRPVTGSRQVMGEASDLYLPKSIARMGHVNAVTEVVIAVTVQVPRSVTGIGCALTAKPPRSRACNGFLRRQELHKA